MNLHLTKPIAFFDLETTGINISKDRIVEISIVIIRPGESKPEIKTMHINPLMAIPLESSLIHGIYEKDIKDAPTFSDIAKSLNEQLAGCDLAGFNIVKFDVPLLIEEFGRVNVDFSLSGRNLVDAQKIFHMMEKRTLSAAYKFYCNKDLTDAHSAEADTLATYEVLKAQIERYQGQEISDIKGNTFGTIDNNMDALGKISSGNLVDLMGRMILNAEGKETFNFGKHKGKLVTDILKKDKGYYNWIMNGDFPKDTKDRLREINDRITSEGLQQLQDKLNS